MCPLTLLAGKLSQHLFHEYAASELSLLPNELQQHTLSLWVDGRYVFQIDDEFAAMNVGYGLFARGRELSHPRYDELALNDYSASARTVDRRDLQCAHLSLATGQGKMCTKCLGWTTWIFNARFKSHGTCFASMLKSRG